MYRSHGSTLVGRSRRGGRSPTRFISASLISTLSKGYFTTEHEHLSDPAGLFYNHFQTGLQDNYSYLEDLWPRRSRQKRCRNAGDSARRCTMRRDLAVVRDGTTEDKLIELWVRLKKSVHTQRAYRHDIEVFRDFVGKPLAAVTLEDALDFCDNLDEIEIVNKRGEAKPLEDNSKRRILNAVKSFYSFAYTSGIFRANVMAAIKPPSAKSAISQRILPEATVLKMILLEQNPRNHAILHVLYAAGLRVSELCNLRWRHVIRRTEGVQLDIIGKGAKQRHVLLSESSWHVLSAIRENASDDDFVFQSRQEVSQKGFYKEAGLAPTRIFLIGRNAAKRPGVPTWARASPPGLRHSPP